MTIKDSEVANLKVGDVFYECASGMNIEARVTKAPAEVDGFEGRRAWEWLAENTQNGESISYRLTEGLSHYGPRLYRQPQYCCVSSGDVTFPLLGANNAA